MCQVCHLNSIVKKLTKEAIYLKKKTKTFEQNVILNPNN